MGTGQGSGRAGHHLVLTLMCRCFRKCCSRQALRPSARTRSWPLGDLIHGLRCWGRGGFIWVPCLQPPFWVGGPACQVRASPLCSAPAPSLRPAGLAHGHGHPEQARHTEGQGVPRSGSALPQPTAVLQRAGSHAAMAPEGQEGMSGAPQGLSIPAACDGGRGEPARGPHLGRELHPSAHLPRQEGVPPPLTEPPPPPCTAHHTVPTAPPPRGSAHPPHTSTMTCRPWGVMFR